MLAKSTRIALELIGALIAGLIVLGALLVWRLGAGPIDLGFLDDYLDARLNPAGSPVQVDVGAWVLDWKGWGRVFDLTARDVTIRERATRRSAEVPWLWLRLSVPALAGGTLAPERVTLNQPRLDLGAVAAGGPPAEKGPVLPLSALSAMAGLFPTLRTIEILDAALDMEIGGLATPAAVTDLDVEISRDGAAIRVDAGLSLSVESETGEGRLWGAVDLDAGSVSASADLMGVRGRWLSLVSPEIAARFGIDGTMDARLDLTLDGSGAVERFGLSAAMADGAISLPDLYDAPKPVEGLVARMAYSAAAGVLEISELTLRADGVPVAATAVGVFTNGALDVSVDAEARDMPVDRIAEFWPASTGGKARTWVVGNLENGTVPVATTHLDARIPLDDPGAAELLEIEGDIRFAGVTAHYFRPLDPATGATGQATYDATRFDIFVDRAALRDIEIRDTEVRLLALDTHSEHAEILLVFDGPFTDALGVLDHDRLALARKFGIDPVTASGRAVGQVRFAFPLIADLEVDALRITADAQLTNAVIPNVVAGTALTGADLDLDLTLDGVQAVGTGVVDGLPIGLAMREAFGDASGGRTTRIRAAPTAASLAALGVDMSPFVEGPLAVDATLTETGADIAFSGVVDLRDAALAIPQLVWAKPAGAAGTLRFALSAPERGPAVLMVESLAAADLVASGRATLSPDGGSLLEATIDELRVGETTLRAEIERADDGYVAVVSGPRLDLRPILDREPQEDRTTPDDAAATGVPIKIVADFDRVRVGALAPIERFRGDLLHDGREIRQIAVLGEIDGKQVSLAFDGSTEPRRFEIASEDAGGLLADLDILDRIQGGVLQVDGAISGEGPDERTVMTLEIRNFAMLDAPLLARLLSATSFTGLADVLRGKGIGFDRLTAIVAVRGDRTEISEATVVGSSIGLTASGTVEPDKRRIDLEGTVIPIYAVNDLIGKIPVLGTIITGIDGDGGILAADYRLSGDLDDPVVSVNPLTVLTPGILKPFVRAFGDALEKQPPPQGDSTQVPQSERGR